MQTFDVIANLLNDSLVLGAGLGAARAKQRQPPVEEQLDGAAGPPGPPPGQLTSFIGENGQYLVLEKSDNRSTSKMSAPRGERKKVDARRNDDEDPQILTTASQSASDTDAPAAAGGGRARKPPGFYRV